MNRPSIETWVVGDDSGTVQQESCSNDNEVLNLILSDHVSNSPGHFYGGQLGQDSRGLGEAEPVVVVFSLGIVAGLG